MILKMKSQISMEFILIFTILIFSITGFIYIINQRITEIKDEQDYLIMKTLVNNIKNELIIAKSVKDNYIRKFDMPEKIRGRKYNISIIDNNILRIQMLDIKKDKEEIYKEYISILPMSIKGNFVKNITKDTLRHCITKNNWDGVRIARNQLGLEAIPSEVKKGEEFNLLITLNCVDDIRSVYYSLFYDKNKIEFKERKILLRSNTQDLALSPLFSSGIQYELRKTDNRISSGFLSDTCETGSGSVELLKFKAIEIGETKIKIYESDSQEIESLTILDCFANSLTKEGLPDSKTEAVIKINPS